MMWRIASVTLTLQKRWSATSRARFALVERVAEEVAELLLARFNSPWVRIKLSKPGAVARAANVGVIIERGNNLKENN